jgi:hypothetical protein
MTFSLTAAWATPKSSGMISYFLRRCIHPEIKSQGRKICILADMLRDVLFEGKEPQAESDLIAHLRPRVVF